jgi:hypothetical protein
MSKVFTAVLVMGLLTAPSVRAESLRIDGVAAWVNGNAITVMDVMREAQPLFGALAQEKGLTRSELNAKRLKIFEQVRRGLADAELIYASYQKDKQKSQVAITSQMVDSRINDMVQEDFGGSREKLMKALADERQTYDEWRERMSRRIIVQGLRAREINAKIQVTPQAVRDYYAAHRTDFEHPGQVQLRRIVLTGPDAAAKSRQLMDRLSAGDDYATLARSPDGGADPSGGGWGWRATEDLSPALLEKLKSMRVGGICQVNLEGDWYIVKLEGRDVIPLEDAQDSIEGNLRRIEAQRLNQLWMEKLEREFHVEFIAQNPWED